MRLAQVVSLLATAAIPALASPIHCDIAFVITESPGSISAPADGTTVSAGQAFPFGVTTPVPEFSSGACRGAFTTVSAYLLHDQPTTGSLNDSFGFSDPLYYFGQYVVTNVQSGSIPENASPPPPTLTMPDLGAPLNGQDIYLAIVEDIPDCGCGYTEYAIDSTAIHYEE